MRTPATREPRWTSALLAMLLMTYAASVAAAECTRPTDPGGANGYDYGKAALNSFGNDRVLIWYTTQGEHAVNSASSRADHVPNDVATVAAVTSDALERYAALGFRAPPPDSLSPACGSNGGDSRFDVYLMNMRGADGQAVPESGRCVSDGPKQCSSYLIAKSNYAEYYDTAELGIRTVLPHETFHAVQNAYDVDLDRFWAEGSAQWAAKVLDPTLTDLERNLPAFFSQSARSLDAPPSGVTSAFLYGSAIWPVFLSERFGDDIVRTVLEREAEQGESAIVASDAVLSTMQSSIADAFPLFAAWNAGTGSRTGSGGYLNASNYPEVDVRELSNSGSGAITSGLASFYFHAQTDAPMQVQLDTDGARNRALLVPLADGQAQVDRVTPLPTELDGEGIVVVSGITTNKKDAPFTVALSGSTAAPASPTSLRQSGGCSLAMPRRTSNLPLLLAPFVAGLVALKKARRTSRVSSARAAGASGMPSRSPR